ncbi:MAG: T9SS type A sorting domain-containing protein [Bacteroidota bacterium]
MKKFLIIITLLIAGCGLTKAQTYNEILGRPTDTSITVSVLFSQNVDLFIEYGTVTGLYPNATTTISSTGGTPDEIDLQNLLPDTKYYYRTRYRASGGGTFLASAEHTFHTQRAAGSTFTFTVESDVHLYDKKGCENLYKVCLNNQAADHPDFMVDMGDTYGDDHHPDQVTSGKADSLHRVYRPILGAICHSVPYYFCLGNHEGEFDYYLAQTPPDNMAVYSTLWRKFYFPNPYPNNFYSGNTEVEPYGMGQPENYYAWTWGDALFVVLDVYRYQCDTSAKPKNWDWTMGDTQYNWFKNTLEGSTAKFKFVFAHQLRGQGRGGVADAPFFEWGGYEQNGTSYGFTTKRPGWAEPIHQLMVNNGVNIFFHGHDHLFAHEVLDSVVYQEVPMPSDSTYEIGMLANADAYVSDTLDGSGHIRVTVSSSCVKVDYVKAWLPIDTVGGLHHNGEVAFSYIIGNCASGVETVQKNAAAVKVFPNPASGELNIIMPDVTGSVQFSLTNETGQILLQSDAYMFAGKAETIDVKDIANGIYFLSIKSESSVSYQKVIISR